MVTAAEVKIGVDILSRLYKFCHRIFKNKKEKKIVSNIYRELLLGDKSDLAKIEAMLLQLEKTGSVGAELVRAKEYFTNIKSTSKFAVKKVPAAKFGKFAAAKTAKPIRAKVVKKSNSGKELAKRRA